MTVDEAYQKIEQQREKKDKRVVDLNRNIIFDHKEQGIECIQSISGCEHDIAEQIYELYHNKIEEIRNKKAEEKAQKQQYIPKCPTCGSPDIKKITGGKRWITTGIFGLGSSNLGKTMECNNCGYKW
ncbi:hypothetical protein [Butyrivibrio sp. INlla21]|uniref:hypothetical protein n=1 Tax=Butyrivibrio sp. INlla21 TaxID=1520811 RepID=UPI0008E2CF19|nr:hypothetical protein [Butyrivibrio sp. INlla21]SFU56971.1 hypothetical protein SAMN02910342_00919 [Butyrivibrio sp. INlla21]